MTGKEAPADVHISTVTAFQDLNMKQSIEKGWQKTENSPMYDEIMLAASDDDEDEDEAAKRLIYFFLKPGGFLYAPEATFDKINNNTFTVIGKTTVRTDFDLIKTTKWKGGRSADSFKFHTTLRQWIPNPDTPLVIFNILRRSASSQTKALTTRVDFPETITCKDTEDNDWTAHLSAIVAGPFGHYECYFRAGKNWYRYNDCGPVHMKGPYTYEDLLNKRSAATRDRIPATAGTQFFYTKSDFEEKAAFTDPLKMNKLGNKGGSCYMDSILYALFAAPTVKMALGNRILTTKVQKDTRTRQGGVQLWKRKKDDLEQIQKALSHIDEYIHGKTDSPQNVNEELRPALNVNKELRPALKNCPIDAKAATKKLEFHETGHQDAGEFLNYLLSIFPDVENKVKGVVMQDIGQWADLRATNMYKIEKLSDWITQKQEQQKNMSVVWAVTQHTLESFGESIISLQNILRDGQQLKESPEDEPFRWRKSEWEKQKSSV